MLMTVLDLFSVYIQRFVESMVMIPVIILFLHR